MEQKVKPIDYLFYMLVAPVSVFCLLHWGWQWYAMVTDRPGLWGDLYSDYPFRKEVYSLYCLLLTAPSLLFLLAPVIFLAKRKREALRLVACLHVFFMVRLFCCSFSNLSFFPFPGKRVAAYFLPGNSPIALAYGR